MAGPRGCTPLADARQRVATRVQPAVHAISAGFEYDEALTEPNEGIYNCDPGNVIELTDDYGCSARRRAMDASSRPTITGLRHRRHPGGSGQARADLHHDRHLQLRHGAVGMLGAYVWQLRYRPGLASSGRPGGGAGVLAPLLGLVIERGVTRPARRPPRRCASW